MKKTRARHPAETTGAVLMGLGLLVLLPAGVGLATEAGGLVEMSPLLGMGLLFGAFGAYVRLSGPLAMQLNLSVNELQLGRFDEARALLDQAEARLGGRMFPRAIFLQRAQLALHAGKNDEALALFERAASVPLGFLARWFARIQRADALSSAALLRAGAGDAAGARRAAARVLSEPSLAAARARATVAELVLLARAGDQAALRTTLDKHRSLLFEATTPRERTLVRAMDRMLDSAARSPYREPAEVTRDKTDAVTDWISEVVPAAAAYVLPRDIPTGGGAEVRFEAPTTAGAAQVARDLKARVKGARSPMMKRTLALWVLLMVMFFAIWQFLQPAPHPAHPNVHGAAPVDTATLPIAPFFTILFGILVAVLVWSARKARASRESLRTASLALTEGDHEAARSLLAPALAAQQVTPKAEAWLLIAQIEEREAKLAEALAACDTALGLLGSGIARAGAYDLLLPAIHAERAFVLAALGRQDESNAEMSRIATEFPSYALKGNADLRVKLAQLAHAGDRAEAARVGRERSPYMQLGRRESALLDVVEALDERGSAEERMRTRHQVDRDRRLGAWLRAVAPSLLAELETRAPA